MVKDTLSFFIADTILVPGVDPNKTAIFFPHLGKCLRNSGTVGQKHAQARSFSSVVEKDQKYSPRKNLSLCVNEQPCRKRGSITPI